MFDVDGFFVKKRQEETKVEGTGGTASIGGSPVSRAVPLPSGDDGRGQDLRWRG
jgi:hypothetical protein